MGKISNNTNNNKGFTLVEVLLLIVVLILVGGLGYLGYKQVNKKSTTSTSSTTASTATTTKTTTPATTPTPNQNIVKIPELGIQITVPDRLKDLTYVASKTEFGNAVAYFSTTTLTNLDAACSGKLGALTQIKGQYGQPGDGGLVKQFSAFWISGFTAQSQCSMDNAAANALQLQQSAVLGSAYPSITQLP
jgi:Tfp pilus assembly major pilin PilA